MRSIIFILLFGLVRIICHAQVNSDITEKRNVYNTKGDFYLERNEFAQALVYYTMAWQKDADDYFSVLKKADAYTKLKMIPQAEECYRIVFETKRPVDNAYRLKYALILLANNKFEEFKQWIDTYSQIVDRDTKDYLVSSENRIKLYKDSSIVLVTMANQLNTKESANLETYKAKLFNDANESTGKPDMSIEGFNNSIKYPVFNSQKTAMYFVSDAPGGEGKMDLYSSRFIDNKWAYPENLGKSINTNGDELYPFLFNDSILYFTSNRQAGFGGLDLYRVNLNNAENTLTNLGNLVNSASDDYNLFLTPDGQTGYFCSNRPGSAAKETIHKVDFINFKIKYAGYQYRRKPSTDDQKIPVFVSNGDEYAITPTGTDNYEFTFQPMDNYKIIIQSENIKVEDILNNAGLTAEQRKRNFLNPSPVQKAEIKLLQGMKYRFTTGQNSISSQSMSALKEKVLNYLRPGVNAINLTVLAKQMTFSEGEIYTVRFVKDESPGNPVKKIEISTLLINDKAVNIFGQSFFVVLPPKSGANFVILTDMDDFEQKFSPKKHSLYIDDSPVFANQANASLISLTVNTDSLEEVNPVNRLSAKEICIIPGTEYLLTLSKPDPKTGENIEVVVPLTRGVKYNLSSSNESHAVYKKALAEFITGRKNVELANEEVIDISVLSKELEVQPGEDLTFSLLPVKQFGRKPVATEEIKVNITLDGKVFDITRKEKYAINIPFNADRKVHFETDLNYIKENFEADAFTLKVDTVSFTSEIVIDTTGYGARKSSGWLSMSVNTESIEEVAKKDQFIAREVSIIPGKEYILTVSKTDAKTGEEVKIIVPLLREVKYDFTSNPNADEAYKKSLKAFLAGRKNIKTVEGEVIDINLISKELQINEGDEISFSLLPVKKLPGVQAAESNIKSSLFLDNRFVEFTQIQKYTINVPLSDAGQVNVQTNIEYLQENYKPNSFTVDIDTIEFFSEITIDTTGYGDRVIKEEPIKDPVFDVVIINYDLNAYLLLPEAMKTIQEHVIDKLKGDSRLYVTIKGYTDALGDADYNLNLSKKRAESVKEYLRSNEIGENRIRTFSYGASQSLKEGIRWEELNETELRKYRKVEIVIYLPK